MVPVITTLSATMLKREPPLMVETLTTAGDFIKSVRRLTIVCKPSTICDAVVTGSMARQGKPAWPRRPAAIGELAGGQARGDMQTENGVRFRILQYALLDHQLGAPVPALRGERGGIEAWPFLGRLEDELHGAGQLVLHSG